MHERLEFGHKRVDKTGRVARIVDSTYVSDLTRKTNSTPIETPFQIPNKVLRTAHPSSSSPALLLPHPHNTLLPSPTTYHKNNPYPSPYHLNPFPPFRPSTPPRSTTPHHTTLPTFPPRMPKTASPKSSPWSRVSREIYTEIPN